MIARKLSWLALEGCLLWLFVRFSSGAALAVAAGLILIPLVSVPVNLYLRRNLTLTLSSEPNLRKGETAELTVQISRGAGRLSAIGCRLRIENLLNGESSKLPLELSGTRRVSVGSAYAGRLRIRAERLRLYDCFGLVGIPVKCSAKCHVTVQPECFESRVTMAPNVNGAAESEVYSQERPGWDLTEPFQLREYIPGDSPRQIHWKLSGKLDRLIVREPGLPIRQDVLVFWERTGASEDAVITDAQAEAVVSLCRALLDASVQFCLGWNDITENRCILHTISTLEELIGVLPRLLSAAGRQTGDTGAELLLQTRPDALCSHMVYIAHHPAADVADWRSFGTVSILTTSDAAMEGAVFFDETNYSAQLAVLEI